MNAAELLSELQLTNHIRPKKWEDCRVLIDAGMEKIGGTWVPSEKTYAWIVSQRWPNYVEGAEKNNEKA